MKSSLAPIAAACALSVTVLAGAASAGHAATPSQPEKEDFSTVSLAVVQLLKTQDTAAFAKEISPSIEDWRGVPTTNTLAPGEDALGKGFQASLDRRRQEVEQSAKRIIEKARELGVNFSDTTLRSEVVPPKFMGTIHYGNVQAEKETLPWTQTIQIVINVEPSGTNAEPRAGGEFRLAANNLVKFPSGWRCNGGVQWVSFPPALMDDKTRIELAILDKASDREPLSQADDPALGKLADALVQFVRERDLKIYESKAMLTLDAVWKMMQRAPEADRRPREELEKGWKAEREQMIAPARQVVAQMENAGLDLKDAAIEVKDVSLKYLQPRSGPGTLDGMEGSQLRVIFDVKSGKKSKTGRPLSGEYVLAANEVMRAGDRWLITQNLHWQKLPAGVLDEKSEAALKLEDYVAEHRTLPPGTAAPDIEFVRLDNEQKGKLSDFRGRVVVLDFWATWCGPCQEPMARMQKYPGEHPDWKGKVEFVPISIDDDIPTVRNHLLKRGWTNTFNVWAGPGAWEAAPTKAFRVSGVPTCYIIDPNGKIAWAGHPAGLRLADVVKPLLEHTQEP